MATHTLGTSTTTSLTCVTFHQSPNVLLPADMATMKAGIKDDLNPLNQSPNSLFDYNGVLMIPRRFGSLRVLEGDVVAFDATTGWVILVSAKAIASGPWVFT